MSLEQMKEALVSAARRADHTQTMTCSRRIQGPPRRPLFFHAHPPGAAGRLAFKIFSQKRLTIPLRHNIVYLAIRETPGRETGCPLEGTVPGTTTRELTLLRNGCFCR